MTLASDSSLTLVGALVTKTGSKSAPAIISGDADSGLFWRNSGKALTYCYDGTGKVDFDTSGFSLSSTVPIQWSSGEVGVNGGDNYISRVASGSLKATSDGSSAYAFFQAKLKTDTNATTGLSAGVLAGTTNASIVIYDGSGQAYRVPCII